MSVRILFAIAVFAVLLILFQPEAVEADDRTIADPPFRWDGIDLPLVLAMNVTNDEIDDSKLATFQIGLYENNTGQPVSNASYVITITDMEANEHIMTGIFFAEEQSRLALELSNQSEETTVIGAQREQFLNAWASDDADEPIVISSPEFTMNKTYSIRIDILGMNGIRNLMPPDEIPRADFVWDPANNTVNRALITPEFGPIVVPMLLASMVGAVIAYNRIRR